MDKWFHNDFEAGQKDDYYITAKDVGELLMITLKNDGGGYRSDWFVDRVTIKTKNVTYVFPCNRWVESEVTFFEGKGKTAITWSLSQASLLNSASNMHTGVEPRFFFLGGGALLRNEVTDVYYDEK